MRFINVQDLVDILRMAAPSSTSNSIAEFVETIDAILVDIEGTTTPISFVTDVLFPYIKTHVQDYLKANWAEESVQADVKALRKLAKEDLDNGTHEAPQIKDGTDESIIGTIVDNVLWQMSHDRKSTPLKQLQGNMWKSAYVNGTVKAIIYEDVPKTLRDLVSKGKKIYVYSSGSVAAQKLLFGYSDQGDLCNIFSGYFDTNIGNKRESSSYKAIAKSIETAPEKILFLTDVYAEAAAAKQAGVTSYILLRPGNKALAENELNEFTTIKTFTDLIKCEEPDSKRQKLAT